MISYTQNFEDVLLNRCFEKQAKGFYIDVGAGHPINDSVTYSFYRRGWNGINIEAAAAAHKLLVRYRPRDANLYCFVSDYEGEVEFFDSGCSGLSSANPAYADNARARGVRVNPVKIATNNLATICAQHEVNSIDFLKIDVEGAEANVIAGMDFTRWRPKVVLLEAIDPITAEYTNFKAAARLEKAGYCKVYFDGINDFFIASEQAALARHFQAPVNFFDDPVKWRDYAPRLRQASPEALAWRRIFDMRLKKLWSTLTVEQELEVELADWEPNDLARPPTAAEIQRVYQQFLGRDPGAAELETWVAHVTRQEVTTLGFMQLIVRSDEYCQKAMEWGGV